MTTRLQDAHVYAFKRSVLDLIMTRDPRDLESLREDFIPWLVKGGWQSALREKWNPGKFVAPTTSYRFNFDILTRIRDVGSSEQ